MTALSLLTAAAYEPLLGSFRYKGAEGGRGSAKSHFFGDLLVDYAVSYPGLRAVCIREIQKTLKRSSKLLLEDKIKQHGLVNSGFKPMREEIRLPGDGLVIFQGMQDHTADSIKSLEGFDVFLVEEGQNLSDRSLELLRPTARRTPRSVLKQPEVWFAWNRRYPTDPVDVFFRDQPPNSVCVHTTFRDNPWFPSDLMAEVEWDRRRDPERYQHVWEGGYLQRSEAQVFKNWKIDEFEVPDDITLHWGADWGFSVDPSVLIGCFIVGRTLYVAFEAWRVGCELDHLPALFDAVDPDKSGRARAWPITGDSQRPDTISYMRRHGYSGITSARKGTGSVEDGVEFLKSYDIVVHPRCIHTADELTFYSYKVDKQTNKVLPILSDKKNHTIDSLRYAVEGVRWAVTGDAHSEASETSRRYDGSTLIQSQRERAGAADAADVGQSAGAAFEGHEYDGGLG
jgi:phage terminase large subunit